MEVHQMPNLKRRSELTWNCKLLTLIQLLMNPLSKYKITPVGMELTKNLVKNPCNPISKAPLAAIWQSLSTKIKSTLNSKNLSQLVTNYRDLNKFAPLIKDNKFNVSNKFQEKDSINSIATDSM